MNDEVPTGHLTPTLSAVASRGLERIKAWLRRWVPSEAGPPEIGETEQQFHQKVFPRELEYVRDRRQAQGDTRPELDPDAPPTVENQLVGLALSGGGIRSATFGLGVIQALERRGVFKYIDFLSTVSGGGFLGSSLATLMGQPSRDAGGAPVPGEFPFPFSEKEDEEATVSHLRNNSNYLAPRGPLDYLRVFAVLVRGIILNFLVLLPFLLICSLVVAAIYGQTLLDRLEGERERQLIGSLVERDWAGPQSEEPVLGLLAALDSQWMIDAHRGVERATIEDWLRGEARRKDAVRRDTLPPLIGEAPGGAREGELVFRPEVGVAEVTERLRISGALRHPDALREVDVVERAVRGSADWLTKAQRGGESLSLDNLFTTLRNEGVVPDDTSPGRFIELLERAEASCRLDDERDAASDHCELVRLRESGVDRVIDLLVAADMTTGDSATLELEVRRSLGVQNRPPTVRNILGALQAEGRLALDRDPIAQRARALETGTLLGLDLDSLDLDSWRPEGRRNLRRILQRCYEGGLFDPAWLERQARGSRFARPLAYWREYELAQLEREILAGLSARQAWALSRDEIDLALLRQRAETLDLLIDQDPDGPFGRQTFIGIYRGRQQQPSAFIPAALPSFTHLGERRDLHEVLHQLWDNGALERTWFERRFVDDAPEADAHPSAYLGQLDVLAERVRQYRATGDRAALPGTRLLLRIGLLWILLYPLVLTFRRAFRLLDSGSRLTAVGLTMLLVSAGALLIYLLLLAQGSFDWMHGAMEWPARLGDLASNRGATLWIVALVALVAIVALPFMAVIVSDLRKLFSRSNAAKWRERYERSFSLLLVGTALVAFIEAQPYLIYHYRQLQAGHIWWSLGIGSASIIASLIAGPAVASFRRFGKKAVLTIVALLGPLLPMLVYIHLVLWVISYPGVYDSVAYRLDELQIAVVLLVLAGIAHIVNLPIDANSTSLHSFYRDRLSRAYLIRREDDTVVPEHDLELSRICPDGSGAPYHLINTALNLQGAEDPRLRRRQGDFFHFSRDFIGSKRTGYCATQDLEKLFPHVHASSAMAISAAAAAPNMGTFTTGPLVVLMALLNIRLGYWIPNPLRVNRWLSTVRSKSHSWRERFSLFLASLIGSFRARPGAYLLLKEMLSLMDADSRMVNLSDGGHMENTGVFELLRRRCQFIIASDAEADPKLTFGGLAALIRYARIDLGIEIDIQPDDLRLDHEGESRQHCTLGFIRYPATDTSPSEVGFLLYIKSSITGDEDELIAEYRGASPSFPHESTADQSFGERQFEAYRDLGYHICSGLFDELGKERLEAFTECGEWFQSLAVSLSPGLAGKVTLADIQTELSNIQRLLREPGYSDYFYEIYPELKTPAAGPEERSPEEAAERFRRVFHLVNIQLQLMEAVFVSHELGQKANREHPGNRGWMNLFRRWAKAQSFRDAYLASITTYSAPFQQFCQAALGLQLHFAWREVSEDERRKLAEASEETGLKLLNEPLEEGGQPLLLTVAAAGTSPIVTGEAVLDFRGEGGAEVKAFEMRPGYQGAGMRARALMALRRWTEERKLSLGFSEAAAVATQSEEYDFVRDADEPGESPERAEE